MPPKPLTTAQFIAKAQAIHGGETYDYSETVYVRSSQKVVILCPAHGKFEQRPEEHLLATRQAAGCQQCGYERMRKKKTGNTSRFIRRVEAVYGADAFDFSQVSYVDKRTKVKVICHKHGLFEHPPTHFLLGRGCPKCGFEMRAKSNTLTTAEFIAKAQAVHGIGVYDYSQTVYQDSRLKVKILCPVHGCFEQRPANHTCGKSGCPKCAEAFKIKSMQQARVSYAKGQKFTLYFLRLFDECEDFYKIGISARTAEIRKSKIESLSGYRAEILAQHTSADPNAVYDWEQSILETFARLRYRPKRSFAGETECFSSAEEILEIFPL